MNEQVYQHYWVTLSSNTRATIAEMFQMRRSGTSEVAGNRLISDGFTNNDLLAITTERINSVLGSKHESITDAFNQLLKFIEDPEQYELEINILKTPNEEIKLDESPASVPAGGSKEKKGKG